MLRSLAGVAALALSALALPGAPAHASSGKELNLTFRSGSARTNAGASSLAVRTLTANGGRVVMVAGRGVGSAARLPTFASSKPPLAVLSVVDQTGSDDLSPGTHAFRFGADFTLDPMSEGSPVDNGNNLLQRGSYTAAMQYKLELDGRRPGCRVKGSQGAVAVQSSRQVDPDRWYRVNCLRQGNTVTLRVVRLSDHRTWTYQRSGAIGTLRAPTRSVPLSVGGKLDARGNIAVGNSDEFNGRVDNAYLNVLS